MLKIVLNFSEKYINMIVFIFNICVALRKAKRFTLLFKLRTEKMNKKKKSFVSVHCYV